MNEEMMWVYAFGVASVVVVILWAVIFQSKRSGRDQYLKITLESKDILSFFHLLGRAACLGHQNYLNVPRLLKMAKKKQVGWKLVAAIVGRYLEEVDRTCVQGAERQQRYLAVANSLLDFFGMTSDKDMKFILLIPCSSEGGQLSRRSLLLAVQDVREIRLWQAQEMADKQAEEKRKVSDRRVIERGQALFNPAPTPAREKPIFPKAVAATQEAGQ